MVAKKKSAPATRAKAMFHLADWTCVHHPDRSEIQAYVEGSGDWQTIAEIRTAGFVDAEPTAEYIKRAVNDYEKNKVLIAELVDALRLCLDCSGLTWEAEHDGEIAIARAQNKA